MVELFGKAIFGKTREEDIIWCKFKNYKTPVNYTKEILYDLMQDKDVDYIYDYNGEVIYINEN